MNIRRVDFLGELPKEVSIWRVDDTCDIYMIGEEFHQVRGVGAHYPIEGKELEEALIEIRRRIKGSPSPETNEVIS